ncbi:hypothetical protein [Thiomicrospira sp.]|uniref:hypothetical protein n=1 Tax=Thiomicrospira sp. TaxID=935 RepID=UPI0025E7D83E|nr:hypothetical protein [Thiomicrospira sp.]
MFLSLSILKTSGEPLMFILIPLISVLVLGYIYFNGQKKRETDSWFIAANWVLAWRRGRILIASYIGAIIIVGAYELVQFIMPGGLAMNDFSDAGGSTPIFEIITMFFGGALIFFAVLFTFLQTGISVYDASKGIIDKKIAQYIPRDENSNPEIGEFNDRPERQQEPS